MFIAHGERDQVIEVGFAREAAARLRGAGIEVDYHESPAAHHIDPRLIPLAAAWVRLQLEAAPAGADAPGERAAAKAIRLCQGTAGLREGEACRRQSCSHRRRRNGRSR